MTVTGGSPASFAGAESPGTTVTINANAAYSVGESGPSGYAETDSADCSSVTGFAPGSDVTCTITNNDVAPTLTVIKHVVNDNGGTATAGQWTMSVAPYGFSFPGAESPGTSVSINAGAYSVSESGGPSGYTASSSAQCSGTAVVGGSYTCTITNDDQAATLTVIKHVINDNGGTATAGQWTITVTGGNASPASFPGSASGTTVSIDANATYTVSESGGPAGYTQTDASIECSSTTGLPSGGSATCTITNDDDVPTFTVDKSSTTTTVTTTGPVTYNYTVTNTSLVTLTGIALNDNNVDAQPVCASTTIAPSGSTTCTATHTVTQAQIDQNGSPTAGSGVLANTVTVTSDQGGSASDSLSIPIQQTKSLHLDKSVSETSYNAVGDILHYTYGLTNTGNVTLTSPSVSDTNVNTGPTYVSGDGNGNGKLDPGETWTYKGPISSPRPTSTAGP